MIFLIVGVIVSKNTKNQTPEKIPQTDTIFHHVAIENKRADEKENSLRISVDSKAKVKIGNLSSEGKTRSVAQRL